VSEQRITEWLTARAGRLPRGFRVGIGDDCAVYAPPPGQELVFTTDMLVEDIHFTRATSTLSEAGLRCLTRGVSDIAAMGATPVFALLSLATPRSMTEAQVLSFLSGVLRGGVPLVGGDLSTAPVITADITVCGATPRGRAGLRSTAKAGDHIYVSGPLGASALGLRTKRGAAWQRHKNPRARTDLALRLRQHATAAMDLSDGLALDLSRLCLASRVGAELQALPIFPGASESDALFGGEDYELLFTTRRPMQRAGLHWIGRMVNDCRSRIWWQGEELPAKGWDHRSGT
jgi:thiamine-monophosphate kinase